MSNVKSHLNAYGFLGAFAAVAAGVSWGLVKGKGDECIRGSYDNLQTYHSAGIVAGIVVLICSVLVIKSFLEDVSPILVHIGAFLIMLAGGVLGYAAYYAFSRPCMPALGFLPFNAGDKNIFSAEDGKMIGVFILDIIGCLMLISAGFNFTRLV